MDYWLESSPDLRAWQRVPATLLSPAAPVDLWDGTGMAEVRATLRAEPALGPATFLRVRALPRP